MPLFWLTFLVGLAYIPGLPSTATVGRWTVLAIGLAIFLWKIRVRPGPAHWAGAALLAWIAFGFTWAVSGWDHAGGAWQWTVMAVAFLVAAEVEDFTPAWRGLAAAVTVSAAFSIWQALGGNPVKSVYEDGAVGLFLSKNMAGEIAVLALVGAIGIRSFALAIGPAAACYLVHSRTVLLSLIVAGLTTVWLKIDRSDRPMAVLAIACCGILIGALYAVDPSIFGKTFYIADRWELVSFFWQRTNLWGDGLGSIAVGALGVEFAHNEFIHYAFELGVPSVLIWGIVIYAFTAAPILPRVALATLLAQCAVFFPLHAPATAMVAALVAGHLCGARGRARAVELGRRARGLRSTPYGGEALGTGEISEACLGRVDLPFRQEPAMDR